MYAEYHEEHLIRKSDTELETVENSIPFTKWALPSIKFEITNLKITQNLNIEENKESVEKHKSIKGKGKLVFDSTTLYVAQEKNNDNIQLMAILNSDVDIDFYIKTYADNSNKKPIYRLHVEKEYNFFHIIINNELLEDIACQLSLSQASCLSITLKPNDCYYAEDDDIFLNDLEGIIQSIEIDSNVSNNKTNQELKETIKKLESSVDNRFNELSNSLIENENKNIDRLIEQVNHLNPNKILFIITIVLSIIFVMGITAFISK